VDTNSCGRGWQSLISSTLEKIHEIDPTLKFSYIKEKFGKLSFGLDIEYYNTAATKVAALEEILCEAEKKSETICEDCGAAGTINYDKYGFWMKCLCESCREIKNSTIVLPTATLKPSKKTAKVAKKDLGRKNPFIK